MHKLWLKDFELRINSVTAEAADTLLAAGAVKSLREVEKHFWVASVDDEEGPYEAEVMITPHKIRAFACECWTEGRRLMCPHIAVALLKVRRFLEQRNEEKQVASTARQSAPAAPRLTVQTALDNATPEMLLAFVKEYARRDRDFATALKTWFAGAMTDAENPYVLVLDSLLPKNGAPVGKSVRDAGFRRLRRTLDDLSVQLQNAAAGGNYRAAHQIGAAILQRILPQLDKHDEARRAQLLPYCREAFQQATVLTNGAASPELRDAAWNLLLELGEKSLYPVELEREAIRFLCEAARDNTRYRQIRALFDRTPFPAPPFILFAFAGALAQRDMPEAVVRTLQDYTEKPDMIKAVFLQLYYLRYWKAAAPTGDYFLGTDVFPANARREVEDILLYIAEQAGDKELQIKHLRRRFLQNGQTELVRKMKTLADDSWPLEFERLEAGLRDKGDLQKLAAAYAADGRLDELATLLETGPAFALLQQYEAFFLPERRDFVREQYVAHLSAYLQEHFGRPASVAIRENLLGLLKKGETELAIGIVRSLAERFGDRDSLLEELNELFPKAKLKPFAL
jgi:hypothetical protein